VLTSDISSSEKSEKKERRGNTVIINQR